MTIMDMREILEIKSLKEINIKRFSILMNCR